MIANLIGVQTYKSATIGTGVTTIVSVPAGKRLVIGWVHLGKGSGTSIELLLGGVRMQITTGTDVNRVLDVVGDDGEDLTVSVVTAATDTEVIVTYGFVGLRT